MLALRNLAGLLPPRQWLEALQLYAEVLEDQELLAADPQSSGRAGERGGAAKGAVGQGKAVGRGADALLWGRMAEAAAWGGKMGLARYALEVGLARAPRHVPLLERAMEVRVVCCVCRCGA